jgi:hypothetical protein
MHALPLAAVLLCSGCVSVTWQRTSRFEPVDAAAVEELLPGEGREETGAPGDLEPGDLERCLTTFGAPLWVWEYRGDGMALAYGWLEVRNWGVNVSLPVSRNFSVSFDYHDIDEEMRGLVLFFGPDLALVGIRRGLLRDLTMEARRLRPQGVDENAAP